jgi:hypothetical protein
MDLSLEVHDVAELLADVLSGLMSVCPQIAQMDADPSRRRGHEDATTRRKCDGAQAQGRDCWMKEVTWNVRRRRR